MYIFISCIMYPILYYSVTQMRLTFVNKILLTYLLTYNDAMFKKLQHIFACVADAMFVTVVLVMIVQKCQQRLAPSYTAGHSVPVTTVTRDCNPGPVFINPAFGIEKYLITGLYSWPLF